MKKYYWKVIAAGLSLGIFSSSAAMVIDENQYLQTLTECIAQANYAPIKNLMYDTPNLLTHDLREKLREAGKYHAPIAYMLCRYYSLQYQEEAGKWIGRSEFKLTAYATDALFYGYSAKLLCDLSAQMLKIQKLSGKDTAETLAETFTKRIDQRWFAPIPRTPQQIDAAIKRLRALWGETSIWSQNISVQHEQTSESLFNDALLKMPPPQWMNSCKEVMGWFGSHFEYAPLEENMLFRYSKNETHLSKALHNCYKTVLENFQRPYTISTHS